MSLAGPFLLQDLLKTADRIRRAPDRESVRISQRDIVGLCHLAHEQHAMIRAAGVAYPSIDEASTQPEGERR